MGAKNGPFLKSILHLFVRSLPKCKPVMTHSFETFIYAAGEYLFFSLNGNKIIKKVGHKNVTLIFFPHGNSTVCKRALFENCTKSVKARFSCQTLIRIVSPHILFSSSNPQFWMYETKAKKILLFLTCRSYGPPQPEKSVNVYQICLYFSRHW